MWLKKIFLLCLALLPFSLALNPSENFDLPLIRLLVPLLFLFWLGTALHQKKLFFDIRPHFWFFIFFLFFCSLSLMWAIEPERGFRRALFLISFLPLWFVTYDYAQKNGTALIVKVLVLSAGLLGFIGLVQFSLQFILGIDSILKIMSTLAPLFLGESFANMVLAYPSWLVNVNGQTLLRAFGTFPDPHLFALFLNMSLPFSFYFYQKKQKNIFLGIAFTLLLASLASFSRASFVSLSVMGVIFVFLNYKKTLLKKPLLTFVFTLMLFLILFLPNPLSQRFFSTFNLTEGSVSGRLEMWKKSVEIIQQFPWLGVGLGNFPYFVDPQSTLRNPIYAHNLFLDFASEIGILATGLLVGAWLYPLGKTLKNPTPLNRAIFFSLIAFGVTALFETPVFSVNIYPLLLVIFALPYEK